MDALIGRLKRLGDLTPDHVAALKRIRRRPKRYERGAVIRRSEESSERVFCVVEGWAVRCRLLPDGQRQILSLLMPGDIADLQALVGADCDHHIIALTELCVEECSVTVFESVLDDTAELAHIFLRNKVQEESMLREQVVRLGRRKARERVLHLLLELSERQRLAGHAEPERLAFALNRETLADMLGLSAVHVSRSLSALARAAVIRCVRGRIEIVDAGRAAALCGFDPAYLHVDAGRSAPAGRPAQADGLQKAPHL